MRGLQAQQSIGMMSELVSFTAVTYERDAFGASIPSKTVGATQYRAQVVEISAKEDASGIPQDTTTRMVEVTMRSLGLNNPSYGHEMIWRGYTYNITEIKFTQRQRFMIIMAKNINSEL